MITGSAAHADGVELGARGIGEGPSVGLLGWGGDEADRHRDGQARKDTPGSVALSTPRRAQKRCLGNALCFGTSAALVLLLGLVGLLLPSKNVRLEIDRYDEATVPAPRAHKATWRAYHKTLKAKAEDEGAGVRVLLVGDSITEELLGTSQGYPRDGKLPLIAWKDYYEELGSLNLGMSGDQTQHVLWSLQNGELPDVLQPESIMVAIGTNNLGAAMSIQNTVDGIRAVVEYLREQRPNALVCVMGLFPRGSYGEGSKPWDSIDLVNAKVERLLARRVGDENIRFVNCNDKFLEEDDDGREKLNRRLIMGDHLHLTVDGLVTWSACVAEVVRSGLTRI